MKPTPPTRVPVPSHRAVLGALCALVLAGCASGGSLRVESAAGGRAYDDVEYAVLRGGSLAPPRISVEVIVYGTVRCSESDRTYPLSTASAGWSRDALRAADTFGEVMLDRPPRAIALLVSPTAEADDAVRLPAGRLRNANTVVVVFSGSRALCDVTAAGGTPPASSR